MRLERLTWTLLTKVSPLGDVTDWSSVTSERTLSIETGIYWLYYKLPMDTLELDVDRKSVKF